MVRIARVAAPASVGFRLEVPLLDSRQQLDPGKDLRHRGGQREAVRQVMIATCSAFEFLSSLVQRAHAALVGRERGFGRKESRWLVCSCSPWGCFLHRSLESDPPLLQELYGRDRSGHQSLILPRQLRVQRFP